MVHYHGRFSLTIWLGKLLKLVTRTAKREEKDLVRFGNVVEGVVKAISARFSTQILMTSCVYILLADTGHCAIECLD